MTAVVTRCQANMYEQLSQLARGDVEAPSLETPRELTTELTLTLNPNLNANPKPMYLRVEGVAATLHNTQTEASDHSKASMKRV